MDDKFIEAARLLKVTLPTKYHLMFEHLARLHAEELRREAQRSLDNLKGVLSGTDMFVDINGKKLKITSIKLDEFPASAQVTFYNN